MNTCVDRTCFLSLTSQPYVIVTLIALEEWIDCWQTYSSESRRIHDKTVDALEQRLAETLRTISAKCPRLWRALADIKTPFLDAQPEMPPEFRAQADGTMLRPHSMYTALSNTIQALWVISHSAVNGYVRLYLLEFWWTPFGVH